MLTVVLESDGAVTIVGSGDDLRELASELLRAAVLGEGSLSIPIEGDAVHLAILRLGSP